MNQRNKGIILSYIFIIVNIGVNFLYVPILLSYMGKGEYGLYQLMGSIIAYFSIMDFGLSATTIKYYSKFKALNDQKNMENVLSISRIVYTLISGIILVISLVVYVNLEQFFGNSLTMEETSSAKMIFVVLVINIIVTFNNYVYLASILSHERFVFSKMLSIISTILQPIAVILIMQNHPSAFAMVLIVVSFNVLTSIVRVYYSKKILKINIKLHNLDIPLIKEMVKFSLAVFIAAFSDQIFWKADQIILGKMYGTEEVAVYSIAAQIYMLYMSLSTAISSVFLPRITSMVENKVSRKEISNLFIKVGRIQYYILGLVLSGFFLYGKSFILLWAGPDYELSYYIAMIIMVPFTIDLIQNIGLTILQALNLYGFRAKVFLFIAIINIVLTIFLVAKLGSIGAAVATGICLFIGNVCVMNVYYQIKVKLEINDFWIQISKISMAIIGSLMVGVGIDLISIRNDYISLAIKLVLYTSSFALIMYFFAFNQYEKNLLFIIAKKIKFVKDRRLKL